MKSVIVTGLVTLVGSGFGTAIVNYWLTERKARRELRRAKLEELFLAVTNWTKLMWIRWLTLHSVMIGKLDYNQALDQMIEGGKEGGREAGKEGFDKVEMIISLYFPELKKSYLALDESRERANKICEVHKRAYKRGENDPKFGKDLLAELPKFTDSEKTLKDHIARLMADVTK